MNSILLGFVLLIVAIVFSIVLVTIITQFDNSVLVRIPVCPEDTGLLGIGQYESGKWEEYICLDLD